MFMSYDGLLFECLRIDDWSRHNVFDEANNYHYTHHEITGAAIINPDLMSAVKFPTLQDQRLRGGGTTFGGKLKSPPPQSPNVQPSDPTAYPGGGLGANGPVIGAGQTSQSSSAVEDLTGITAIREAIERAQKAIDLIGAADAAAGADGGFAGPAPDVPGAFQGGGNIPINADAALTDFIVRQRLAVPRRKLLLWMHSNLGPDVPRILLESPLGTAVTDCRNGPQFDVTWFDVIGGNLSLVIGFKVTTDVNNWVPSGGSPGQRLPALLGNSWSYTVTHDQDYFATHTIEGTAVFRQDAVMAQGINEADLRAEFMHPIPLGFKRTECDVKQIADGTALIYRVLDVEQPMHFVGGLSVNDKISRAVKPFASRIEVVEEQEHSQPLNNRSWNPFSADFWDRVRRGVYDPRNWFS